MDSRWILSERFTITSLENDLQDYLKQNCFVVVLISGTAAIHLELILWRAIITETKKLIYRALFFATQSKDETDNINIVK